MDIQETLHKTSPPSCFSRQLFSDNLIHAVSESSLLRVADLVRQPRRWGAEPLAGG